MEYTDNVSAQFFLEVIIIMIDLYQVRKFVCHRFETEGESLGYFSTIRVHIHHICFANFQRMGAESRSRSNCIPTQAIYRLMADDRKRQFLQFLLLALVFRPGGDDRQIMFLYFRGSHDQCCA